MLFLINKCLLNDKNEKKIIVDFCSGGGHLGILVAYMHPNCIVKLVENKEESLEFAINRIQSLNLKNCSLYKGNLTNFVGKFNETNVDWFLSGGIKNPSEDTITEAEKMAEKISKYEKIYTQESRGNIWNYIYDKEATNTAENFIMAIKKFLISVAWSIRTA